MKRNLPLLLSALAALVAGSFTLSASAEIPADRIAEIVEPAVANGRLNALSIGVIRGDESATFHFGTLSNDVPQAPDDETIYEIGSISKVFTAILLTEAVRRDEVQLDTTVNELLPPEARMTDEHTDQITLRMLSTHTSGMPRVPSTIPTDNFTDPYATFSRESLLTYLPGMTLDFEPGTQAAYSNLAVGLLGTLLEMQADASYEQLLQDRICGPLGMTSTFGHPRRCGS